MLYSLIVTALTSFYHDFEAKSTFLGAPRKNDFLIHDTLLQIAPDLTGLGEKLRH